MICPGSRKKGGDRRSVKMLCGRQLVNGSVAAQVFTDDSLGVVATGNLACSPWVALEQVVEFTVFFGVAAPDYLSVITNN